MWIFLGLASLTQYNDFLYVYLLMQLCVLVILYFYYITYIYSLYTHLLMDIWIIFSFGLFINKAAVAVHVQVLYIILCFYYY